MNKNMILLAIFAIVMISCSKNDLMDFGNKTTSLDVQNLNRSNDCFLNILSAEEF